VLHLPAAAAEVLEAVEVAAEVGALESILLNRFGRNLGQRLSVQNLTIKFLCSAIRANNCEDETFVCYAKAENLSQKFFERNEVW
jgi:hypothetical protein